MIKMAKKHSNGWKYAIGDSILLKKILTQMSKQEIKDFILRNWIQFL